MSTARTPAEVATAALGKEPTTDAEREEWARLRDVVAAERAASAGLATAVGAFALLAGQMYDAEALGGLTCSEVEAMADVLRVAGYADEAEVVVEAHSVGDDDPYDEHHNGYRANLEEPALPRCEDCGLHDESAASGRCEDCAR